MFICYSFLSNHSVFLGGLSLLAEGDVSCRLEYLIEPNTLSCSR